MIPSLLALAFSLADVWAYLAGLWSFWVWPIILVILGFGLVIFVHELGHFLLAKRVGIKVERFALGMGPRLFGVKYGETDYCVNLLPVGGYVKMLGQEDFKPLEEGGPGDPGAYSNKSVGARIAVVSSGVVMNVIFAAILFIIVGLVGIRRPAAIVGGVEEGYPAAQAKIVWDSVEPAAGGQAASRPQSMPAASQASTGGATQPSAVPFTTIGLEPGDEIYRVRGSFYLDVIGQKITRFEKLTVVAALAAPNDVFHMSIRRNVDGQVWLGTATLGVKSMASETGGTRLGFGIDQPSTLTLAQVEGYKVDRTFEPNDVIEAVGGQKVRHFWDIKPIRKTFDGRVVQVTVRRNHKLVDIPVEPMLVGGSLQNVLFLKDGSRIYGRIITTGASSTRSAADDEHVKIQVAPDKIETVDKNDIVRTSDGDELLDILGLIPRLKVTSVEKGSPAGKAGLEPGDIIVDYADRGAPTLHTFYEINDAFAGKETSIVVLRSTAGREERLVKWIKPTRHDSSVLVGVTQATDQDNLVVAGVRPGSGAAQKGLEAGDRIEAVNGQPVRTWVDLYQSLKALEGQTAAITFRQGASERTAEIGRLTREMFDPQKYEFSLFSGPRLFEPLMGPKIKKDPLAAIAWGTRETWDFLVMTYATLHSWMQGNLSGREFSGPLGIGRIGIHLGRKSLIELVYFMAMISVSLAVVNFLPIPVFDGGHVLFLIIEKARRKPVPVRILNIAQIFGLLVIVLIFVLVTWNDIRAWVRNLW